jgi:peptidase M1-like protein
MRRPRFALTTWRSRRCHSIRRLGAGLMLVLAACSPVAPAPGESSAAPTAQSPNASATVLTAETPAPAPSQTAVLDPSPIAAWPTAVPVRPEYDLHATLDLVGHVATVAELVRLIPPETAELVFNFNALQTPGVVADLTARVNEAEALPWLEGVWLHVPLAAGMAADKPLTVSFAYRLLLPAVEPWAWAWRGTLGYTPAQINLGDWYPVLAWHSAGGQWVRHAPSPLGEYMTAAAAQYVVRLSAADSQALPLVAGSGAAAECGGDRCFALSGARFAAYVVAPGMQAITATTRAGQLVTSVYLPEHAVAGEAALKAATAALDIFSDRYGASPQPAYTQIEGDFYDGMEYSGLGFVGRSYYEEYDGTPQNLLTIISAHEAAHQWWHTLVGNDQAAEPWLDEALAVYSELVFLETEHPTAAPWWWLSRVDSYQPSGPVDGSIYEYLNFRTYVDGVYLRGAQMLHAMRQALGDDRFFGFLRAYAAAHAGGVASGADFWQAYAEAGGDGAAIRGKFMGP